VHQVHVAEDLVVVTSDNAHADRVEGKLVKGFLLISDFSVIRHGFAQSIGTVILGSKVLQLLPVLFSELSVFELNSTV